MAEPRLLSVAEVADRLQVTRARVRQLIEQRALTSRRVGHQLVVEEGGLRSVIRERSPGRPVSPELAWGIALAAEDCKPAWLSPTQRSRAAKIVRSASPVEVRAKLARRAEIARYHASARGLNAIRAHAASRPAGTSLSTVHAVDLLMEGVIERYIGRNELHEVVRRTPLMPDMSQPNVILHVLEDTLWNNVRTLAQIPPVAVASDLIEVGFLVDDDRWQRAGWDLLSRSWPGPAA